MQRYDIFLKLPNFSRYLLLYYIVFLYFVGIDVFFLILSTQVSEVKIQYSMPSGQVGLVMPSGDCQQ